MEITPAEPHEDPAGYPEMRNLFFEGMMGYVLPPGFWPDPAAVHTRRPSPSGDLLIGDGEDWRSSMAPPGPETAAEAPPEPPEPAEPAASDGE